MNLNRPIKAFILDDEQHACKNLERYLVEHWADAIEITGIAQNTVLAAQMMASNTPDVIFIDIEMPGENAFQFIERVGLRNFEIIFVTAYDEYALRALKLNAIDYILKPISDEELNIAILKLMEKLALKEALAIKHPNFNLGLLIDQVSNKEVLNNIVLRDRGETVMVRFEQIIYLAAQGSYTQFIYKEEGKSKELIMSYPMSHYEEILPNNIFYRIHKSHIICRYFFKKITKNEEQWLVVMTDDSILPLSRRRHLSLLEFLKEKK